MGKLTLILGGARSGKSTWAQQLAARHAGRVVYLATATAGDEEMSARIEKHQQERSVEWVTREIPHGIAAALAGQPILADVVLLDCLTLLVSNVMLQGVVDFDNLDEIAATEQVEAEIISLLCTLQTCSADWIIVSNEVGLGLVPPYPLGRTYRDMLGRVNQKIAVIADEVYWLMTGIPVPIHQFRVKGEL